MLDHFYISIFNHYKKSLGKKSLIIALIYINFLELTLILLTGLFFMAFATQMNLIVMSIQKFLLLFVLTALGIVFKNWIKYNGKKRHILNAKLKAKKPSIVLLWLLPFSFMFLAFVIFQAI